MGSQGSNVSSGGKLILCSDWADTKTDFNLCSTHILFCTLYWTRAPSLKVIWSTVESLVNCNILERIRSMSNLFVPLLVSFCMVLHAQCFIALSFISTDLGPKWKFPSKYYTELKFSLKIDKRIISIQVRPCVDHIFAPPSVPLVLSLFLGKASKCFSENGFLPRHYYSTMYKNNLYETFQSASVFHQEIP